MDVATCAENCQMMFPSLNDGFKGRRSDWLLLVSRLCTHRHEKRVQCCSDFFLNLTLCGWRCSQDALVEIMAEELEAVWTAILIAIFLKSLQQTQATDISFAFTVLTEFITLTIATILTRMEIAASAALWS
jgi:hypothetical protein